VSSNISSQTRLLRVVTLASKSGRYGGPFDTSMRQMELASRLGYESHVLAGHMQDDQAINTAAGVRLHTREVKRFLPFGRFGTLHSWALLRALLKLTRLSDVVHVSLSRELIPLSAVLFARILRKPLIVQPHGMLTSRTSPLHRAVDLFVRPLIGKKAIFVALTEVEAGELRRWSKRDLKNMMTLGNPLPPELHSVARSAVVSAERDSASPLEALFVARLHKRKRVDLFLDAAALAHEMGWAEAYVVIGPDDGDLELVLQAQSRLPNVTYEGSLSAAQVTLRVQQCGVFVLPSESEPWGNVLATALGLHKPVVVTRSTALGSAIERFGAGLVVPDNNSESLASAIHTILTSQDDNLSAKVGARTLAQEMLAPESQSSQLRQLYLIAKSL
jgi:glycosyltransferase involved in cell wall biosynthesis